MEQLFIFTNACICGIILCYIIIEGVKAHLIFFAFPFHALMRSVATQKNVHLLKFSWEKRRHSEIEMGTRIIMLNEALAEVYT